MIRKYLTSISLTPTNRFANGNRELVTSKSDLLSVFLSPHCYAVERYFRRKRYKSLTFGCFRVCKLLESRPFCPLLHNITVAIYISVYMEQNLCVVMASGIGLSDIGFSDVGKSIIHRERKRFIRLRSWLPHSKNRENRQGRKARSLSLTSKGISFLFLMF